MRTQVEILNRIREVEKDHLDFLGTQRSDLIDHLDYENAKSFLKDNVTIGQWQKENRIRKNGSLAHYLRRKNKKKLKEKAEWCLWFLYYSVYLSLGIASSRFLLPILPIMYMLGFRLVIEYLSKFFLRKSAARIH